MPLIPALQAFLDRTDLAALAEAGLAGANAMAADVADAPLEVGSVHTVSVPVADGEILARIYQPATAGPHPIHLYLHGGGWVAGTIEERFVDVICRERTALAGYVTITAEYRLAPQFKFPTAVDDSYAALLWIVENAAEYDADPQHLTVGGGSAGGNLAAALTLKARDEAGPTIEFQVLEVPALDLTWSSPSVEAYGRGDYPLTKEDLLVCGTAYLGSTDSSSHPYASPLLVEDLSGLPPALIISSEYDVLQTDGSRYAARLEEAGVPATFILGEGQIHGSSQFTKLLPESAAWRDLVITALKEQAHQWG